jgi:micrococcal nuclease
LKHITFFSILFFVFAAPIFSQAALTQATVLRVIDGDTLELVGGERVRLIGVDAPEPGRPGALEATHFVRERVEGRTVWLEADGANRDRFGRLRRYVWLQQPTNPNDAGQIRQHQLNALLLANGHARVMIIGNVRNEALFRQLAASGGS